MSFTSAQLTRPQRCMLAEAAQAEIARRDFLTFCKRAMPRFETPRHIALLADYLTRLEAGEIKRLVISAPPRNGKSNLAQLFSAWYAGRNPSQQIIVASYSQHLSDVSSYRVREIMQDESWPFDTRVKADSQAKDFFRTDAGGYVISAGVGARITGFGGNLVVCDDLIKGAQEAQSDTVLAETNNWFAQNLLTRTYADSRILVIGTRWSDRDPVATLLENDPDGWTVVNLPALAEDDDLLGREPGEALWPERFPVPFLRGQQTALGSAAFAALYQGQPVPATGVFWQRAWLDNRFSYDDLPRDTPPEPVSWYSGTWAQPAQYEPLFKVTAVDSSWGQNLQSDYSVILTAATDGSRLYILDVLRGRWQIHELQAQLLAAARRHRPSVIAVEQAASGFAVIQGLRSTLLPILPVIPKGSKESRVSAVLPLFEAGRVLLPRDGSAPWLDDYVSELLRFNAGKHDDQVDATQIAVSTLMRCYADRQTTDELYKTLGHVSFAP